MHFFRISILLDFQPFYNHPAFLHVSNEYFENHILKIVTCQHSKTYFDFDELTKMTEILASVWVTIIAGHPVQGFF